VCAAYQLHLGAINSISLGEGLAVTGSDDKTLRVWPLDFSSHLLEAEHEAAVTATAVGCGGARVVLGSEDGVLGLLDVVSRQYHTLLRSHCKEVLQVVASPTRWVWWVVSVGAGVFQQGATPCQMQLCCINCFTAVLEQARHARCQPMVNNALSGPWCTVLVACCCRPEYCTVSADHTIRVWDIHHHHQLYEFSSGGEAACCAAYHPDGQQLALGFSSGRVRLFHLPTTSQLLVGPPLAHQTALLLAWQQGGDPYANLRMVCSNRE
jgi:WD40 repeat protein